MSLQQQIMEEWREDADMGDDLFEAARNIPILHSKWIDKYLRINSPLGKVNRRLDDDSEVNISRIKDLGSKWWDEFGSQFINFLS